MSLGVAIKGPEGIVLAADSRVTVGALFDGHPLPVHYDNATKVLKPSDKYGPIAAITYGQALVAGRTAHSYLPELELVLPNGRIRVEEFTQALSKFFMARLPSPYEGPPLTFVVGGFNENDPYGCIFVLELPHNPEPQPRNPGNQDFGITWGGQLEVAARLIHGYDPVLPSLLAKKLSRSESEVQAILGELRSALEFKLPYGILPLQDCVDLATFLIRTTITAQSLSVGIRGVGGQIEVVAITRTGGVQFVQQKRLRGEPGFANRDARPHGEQR